MEKNKILIVEDNKALAKLIAKKMEDKVEMEIDVAHTMAEAQAFLNNSKDYFIALLDLNLPDAPNGEIVDYVISKGLPSIVLTGSIDDATRESFIHKDIVDYVYKGNMDDINYIFKTINRLSDNRRYKAMVVEDSAQLRSVLKKILTSLQFHVFTAAHGEEAMNYFADNPDIKIIVSDYKMPVKDGLEVLKEIRTAGDKDQIGVIMMTSPEDGVNGAIFLKNGANDFIAKPFVKEELICRVNNLIEAMENINQIADFANKDFLTGLFNRRYFYDDMQEYLSSIEENPAPYAVALIDVDGLKDINDKYGQDGGDKILKHIAKRLIDDTKSNDTVARFGSGEFCVVLKNMPQEDAVKFLVSLRAGMAANPINIKNEPVKISVSIGVTFGKTDYAVDEILDIADEALHRAKENGRNRVEIA
ncbi:GGDEF domain-containing response regulator [Campylobacter showae]|jgi:3-deoxy-d-manno-octulosonic-acid transferase|uniref:GGDEF domain-containing response regulator n=1 Tax=Campylobacter showae TaxID=204 RepID=UPI000F08278D|nr:diguanylate cyclase [Campylobacter showae]